MFTNIRNATEAQLLEFVRDILAKTNRTLSRMDKIELRSINDEFIRRDALRASNLCAYCHQPRNGNGWYCTHCGAC